MSTIYTLNGKVLKNSANDKWLTKKEVDPYSDSVTRAAELAQIPSSWGGTGA